MFNRNDLTISMFYASSTNDDGSKTAAITVQVNGPTATAVQTSQLLCVTDKAKVKTYVVGEQSIKDGSDPAAGSHRKLLASEHPGGRWATDE